MVDTSKVFKEPVRCVACGSQQYETLLRIAQGTPITCVECRQGIDLPRDNPEIFASTVAFVRSEWLGEMRPPNCARRAQFRRIPRLLRVDLADFSQVAFPQRPQ